MVDSPWFGLGGGILAIAVILFIYFKIWKTYHEEDELE